jgi:hypothetical protein
LLGAACRRQVGPPHLTTTHRHWISPRARRSS